MTLRRKIEFKVLMVLLFIFLGWVNFVYAQGTEGNSDNTADWFYPSWVANAPYNNHIVVRDTESSLGRYSLKTKTIGLKDLTRIHGHLCDGLVISFVQIKEVLARLFPEGVVDRTDLRAVSKNGPCWVDAIAFMTGSRINFQTLRIDNAVGDGFIIQMISTSEAYLVHLKPGVFPEELKSVEAKIRQLRAEGRHVEAKDIDAVETMQNNLSKKILTTPSSELLVVERLKDYQFHYCDFFGERGDVINKNMGR
ncbi:MAG TPA: formylmethanofuran dehydrogenase subunit E family protein [Thermodesulfobacteriota bacterium]|nr:formylmethanofuran dehydrogenase subunit E family protein [Thermodesulfobacteriota bacterium]